MPLTISIAMATHNRAAIMLRTIESLRNMDLPPSPFIELIVVANACTDRSVAAINALAPGMPFPTRCVEEPAEGLCHARNRAIREATGEIIVFIDDDIWVSRNWLTSLVQVFESHPAEIACGKTMLWWDAVARPAWMDRRAEHLLSCADYGDKIIELKSPGLVIGVNFAVRREIFDRLGPFANLGRTPLVPLGGDDTEFFTRAIDAGCRIFYVPTAEVKHWVAPHRITLKYLSLVAYSNGLVRPYFSKRFSRLRAARTIIQYTFRWLVYCMLEFFSWGCFNRKSRVNQRIRRMACLGTVRGTFRRLRRLSPLGAAITPSFHSPCAAGAATLTNANIPMGAE